MDGRQWLLLSPSTVCKSLFPSDGEDDNDGSGDTETRQTEHPPLGLRHIHSFGVSQIPPMSLVFLLGAKNNANRNQT